MSKAFENGARPTPEQSSQGALGARAAFASLPSANGDGGDPFAQWLSVRGVFPRHHWGVLDEVPVLRQDAHREYIERKERDPRMERALGECRQWATGTSPLSLNLLLAWQALISIEPILEGAPPERLSLLQSKIGEANNQGVSVDWRAATAYQDLQFFHPSALPLARLALDGLLWREGFALQFLDPIFVVSRTALHERGGGCLASLTNSLLGRRPV